MLQMSVWKEEMNCKNPLLGSSLIKFFSYFMEISTNIIL